jgi:prokaryotic ubiquitin-like protein Pup
MSPPISEDNVADQEQTRTAPKQEEQDSAPEAKDLAKKKEKLDQDADSLIDEIDAVLEENAAAFIANYIQRGGQ